jgi:uncharacterized protein
MNIQRNVEKIIKKNLFQKKIVIVYGARQVGKTTLVKKIAKSFAFPYTYLNCDEGDILFQLQNAQTSHTLKTIIGDNKLIIIDEAQRVKDIGLKLKLLIDNYPNQQIIATGSSSFDLSNEVNEPLTGRSYEFWLFPLSISEIRNKQTVLEFNRQLENLLIYGSYPEIYLSTSYKEKEQKIKYLASNYLYKDILKFSNLKNSEIVTKLLQALALQIGSEVSYNELAKIIGISKQTVSDYVLLLEKAFIIFRLSPYSSNLRKELSKLRKIYFLDIGVRNALINNQNKLQLRNDVGKLWENFVIAEKYKKQYGLGFKTNFYFWRTYDQQEVDLVEDKGGRLTGWEIKWSAKTRRAPKAWRETYTNAQWKIINRNNYLEYLTD